MATTKVKTQETPAEEVAEKEAVPVPAKKPVVAKATDPEQYVTVRNGFQGKLVYRSSRSGEKYVWDSFGSEQEMQLRELLNAKSAHKGYFSKNWFMFDEDWIVDYLGVGQFYKNSLKIDEFDELFEKKPEEVERIVSGLSEGQKRSVEYRAKELIRKNEIDSLKVISVLEKALGTELIEK